MQPYLSVDNGCHPETLAGPGNWKHGPQEDEDGEHQGYHGGRNHVIQNDDKVTHHFRARYQRVVEGIAKL